MAAFDVDVRQLKFRDPGAGARLVAGPAATDAGNRSRAGQRDARVRQPRAGDRALRPAGELPEGARRVHGAGLSGVHHRPARGRRGRGAGRSRACASRPTATCCGCRAPRSSLADAKAEGAHVEVVYSVAQAVELARQSTRGAGVLRHRLRDHGGGHGGGAARRAAAQLLGAVGAQVHPAGDGDRRGDARDPRRGLPGGGHAATITGWGIFERLRRAPSASPWSSPASSRSTSSPGWWRCSSRSATGAPRSRTCTRAA